MSLIVRPATSDDAAAIAGIEAAVEPGAWTDDRVRAHLTGPASVALVATDGPVVIGHVLATAAAGEGEIITIAVDDGARRRGIGRALLDALEAAWRERGVVDAWLEVREDNGPAIALYSAVGWEGAGRRRRYYRDGADALVMRRSLSS